MTPCSLVDVHRRFGRTCSLHSLHWIWRKVVSPKRRWLPTDNEASIPGTQWPCNGQPPWNILVLNLYIVLCVLSADCTSRWASPDVYPKLGKWWLVAFLGESMCAVRHCLRWISRVGVSPVPHHEAFPRYCKLNVMSGQILVAFE